jgi:hypothetical protein
MRAIIALTCVLLSSPSLASAVRHRNLPERLWGTWAPSADRCRDNKSTVVVSETGYVTRADEVSGSLGDRNRGPQRANLFGSYALLEPRSAGANDGIESHYRAQRQQPAFNWSRLQRAQDLPSVPGGISAATLSIAKIAPPPRCLGGQQVLWKAPGVARAGG